MQATILVTLNAFVATVSELRSYQENICRVLKNPNVWFENFEVKGRSKKPSHTEPSFSFGCHQTIPWGKKKVGYLINKKPSSLELVKCV